MVDVITFLKKMDSPHIDSYWNFEFLKRETGHFLILNENWPIQ